MPLRLYHVPEAASLAQAWAGCFERVACAEPPADEPGFFLWADSDHLELRRGPDDHGRGGGVWITRDELARRASQGGDLARACGVTAARAPTLLDAMAGWGVDGLVLAARGARVTLVERHPALWALEQDLIRRSGIPVVACRCEDGFAALSEAGGWDVVYLDPLFPERAKGALPGKRMQYVAALAQPDDRPLEAWLAAARPAARQRVVLKRRRKDPEVAPPDWQILGRTVRYDVYRGSG